MQKLWNWFVDKKSHQIRKWYSTVLNGGGGPNSAATAAGAGALAAGAGDNRRAQYRQQSSSPTPTRPPTSPPTRSTSATGADRSGADKSGSRAATPSSSGAAAAVREPTPTPTGGPGGGRDEGGLVPSGTSPTSPSPSYHRRSYRHSPRQTRQDHLLHRRRSGAGRRPSAGIGAENEGGAAASSTANGCAAAGMDAMVVASGSGTGSGGGSGIAGSGPGGGGSGFAAAAGSSSGDESQGSLLNGGGGEGFQASPINFEQFFDESASAIQIALERRGSGLFQHPAAGNEASRKGSIQMRSGQDDERFGANLSVENRHLNRRSESARLADHPVRRHRNRIPSANFEFERNQQAAGAGVDDDESSYSAGGHTILKCPHHQQQRSPTMSKKRSSLPQVSVSFADNPSTSTIIFEDRIPEEDEEGDDDDDIEDIDADDDEDDKNDGKNGKWNKNSPKNDRNRRRSLEGRKYSGGIPNKDEEEERRRFEQLQLRRQSNIQYVQAASGRRTSTTLLPLTAAQIHLIRTLWRQIYLTKGPTVIGTTLFHRIFFKSIKIKEQFRQCLTPKHYPNHDCFAKAHAKAVAELIQRIVDNLDNLESVSDELIRIGTIHAQISEGQISGKMWNLAAETFIDCTLEWGDRRCRSETVRKAWALIIAFTFEKVKEGHALERRHQSQMRLSSLSSSPMSSPKRQP